MKSIFLILLTCLYCSVFAQENPKSEYEDLKRVNLRIDSLAQSTSRGSINYKKLLRVGAEGTVYKTVYDFNNKSSIDLTASLHKRTLKLVPQKYIARPTIRLKSLASTKIVRTAALLTLLADGIWTGADLYKDLTTPPDPSVFDKDEAKGKND